MSLFTYLGRIIIVSPLYYDVILVAFKGARAVSRVPLHKDLFVG
jgi:hypothetical protein